MRPLKNSTVKKTSIEKKFAKLALFSAALICYRVQSVILKRKRTRDGPPVLIEITVSASSRRAQHPYTTEKTFQP